MPRRISTAVSPTALHCVLWLLLLVSTLYCQVASALHHNFYLKHDLRTVIGPVGMPFGFLEKGYYDLQVFDFKLNIDKRKYKPLPGTEKLSPREVLDQVEAGFLLKRFTNEAAFVQYIDELRANATMCTFEFFLDEDDAYLNSLPDWTDDNEHQQHQQQDATTAAEHGIYLSMKDWYNQDANNQNSEVAMRSIQYTFRPGEEGLYFLIYQICPTPASVYTHVPHGIMSSFELDFHFINFDRWNKQSYLTAGEMKLPMVFFYFSVSYAFCFGWWVQNIRQAQADRSTGRPVIYAIHHIMSALILLKTVTILLKSIRYHFLRVSGHAEVWSFVYYLFYFLKGTFLFTVILLIGSGWSIVKPFLNGSEKKVILAVLILQVINNIALIVLARETEGESTFQGWTAVLHLVDIICCCAVLVPIVWQVNQLEKSVTVDDPEHPDYNGEDELANGDTTNNNNMTAKDSGNMEDLAEKGRILEKLKLFRGFYMLVVAYIYSTRILVYLFSTMLSYQHLWFRDLLVELVTLCFYVVTGYMFRPMKENPYFGVKREVDDENMGDDDNFINGRELEMSNI